MTNSAVEQAHSFGEPRASEGERARLLQRVQPALSGLIDGSLSSLAPIFAVVMSTHRPGYAFVAGLATAIGAAISMAFSEGLSDTGTVTERDSGWKRGAVVGVGITTTAPSCAMIGSWSTPRSERDARTHLRVFTHTPGHVCQLLAVCATVCSAGPMAGSAP